MKCYAFYTVLHNIEFIASTKTAAAKYESNPGDVTQFVRYRVNIIAVTKLIGARKIRSGSVEVDTTTAV